ncbi:hypothetical protein AAT19DRAFT_12127 [Rhodotorula toruloides]|uniref:Uncharacterized protein n=1 Tax=Rhodotorula toruloides TaxID=5286 RepID=A0A2T0AFC4_RHOTO|nr:hypothetical protein AAT19DRAFT_12127 [Rhodotorula toruloides]
MQEDLPASDADAEAALRDVELEVELRSAVSVSSGGSTDAAGMRSDDDNLAVDGGAKAVVAAPQSENAAAVAVTPARRAREPSLPSAISSPASTPSRKRRKLSHEPDDLSHMPPLHEQDDLLESDGGISSPAAASTAAEAGWALTSEADELPASDVLSSPVKPSSVEAPRIKRELDDITAPKQPVGQLGLSSDPILLSSDVVDADDDFERAPRPGPNRKSPRRIKGPKAPAKSSSGAVKPKLVRDSKKKAVEVLEDTPKAAAKGSSSKKSASRKKAPAAEEDEDEAVSEAVKTVAASWRARFMMPAAGVRVRVVAGCGVVTLADTNALADSSLGRNGLHRTSSDANNDLASPLDAKAADGDVGRHRQSKGCRNLESHPALASLDESHRFAPGSPRRRSRSKVIISQPPKNPHSDFAPEEDANRLLAGRRRTLVRPFAARSGHFFLARRRHEPSTTRLPLHRHGQAQLSVSPILVDLRNPQLSQDPAFRRSHRFSWSERMSPVHTRRCTNITLASRRVKTLFASEKRLSALPSLAEVVVRLSLLFVACSGAAVVLDKLETATSPSRTEPGRMREHPARRSTAHHSSSFGFCEVCTAAKGFSHDAPSAQIRPPRYRSSLTIVGSSS